MMVHPFRTAKFGWYMLISAPLRITQIAIITALTFVLHWLASLFDLPLPAPRENDDPDSHEYRAPRTKGPGLKDSRSPCPALNTLANHGYLPRNGRNIRPYQFIQALQEGYNLSYPLAAFLTWGSFILVQQWKKVSLKDLARHGLLEHDASLAHVDAAEGAQYAPTCVDESYLSLLLDDATDGFGLTAEDIAKARVRRESAYPQPLDVVHAEIGGCIVNLLWYMVDSSI